MPSSSKSPAFLATPKGAPAVFHYRKPVRSSVVWWLRLLGVIALIVLLLRLPPAQDVHLAHIDLRWLGFCMLLTIFHLLLEACAWQSLLWIQRIRYPYPKTLLAYIASQYLGLVTPGHVGEFLAAGYISMDTGITFGYALSSVVMNKILNLVVVIGFGLRGVQLLGALPVFQEVRWEVVMRVGALVVLASGVAIWIFSLRQLARKWQKLSPWQLNATEFRSGLRQLCRPQLVIPLAIDALAFCLLFVQMYAVLRALGIHLSLGLISRIVAFSRIVGRIVPISIVGFGSKDAAVIGLLSQQGIEPSVGLTAMLLLLICSYLLTLLLSAVCWWTKPLVIRRVPRAS